MGTHAILGAERAPTQAAGRDTEALGPSDSSDSGSDIQGEPSLNTPSDRDDILSAPRSDHPGGTDASGTGERSSATPDEKVRDGGDISADHIENFNGINSEELLEDDDLVELATDDEHMEGGDEDDETPSSQSTSR